MYYGQIRFIVRKQRYLTLEKPINIFLILTDKGSKPPHPSCFYYFQTLSHDTPYCPAPKGFMLGTKGPTLALWPYGLTILIGQCTHPANH